MEDVTDNSLEAESFEFPLPENATAAFYHQELSALGLVEMNNTLESGRGTVK